jgi:hypothetical protein
MRSYAQISLYAVAVMLLASQMTSAAQAQQQEELVECVKRDATAAPGRPATRRRRLGVLWS